MTVLIPLPKAAILTNLLNLFKHRNVKYVIKVNNISSTFIVSALLQCGWQLELVGDNWHFTRTTLEALHIISKQEVITIDLSFQLMEKKDYWIASSKLDDYWPSYTASYKDKCKTRSTTGNLCY